MSWLLFDVGDSRLAIPGADLLEVVPAEGLVRAPDTPPEIAGALAFRQEVIAVVDLGPLLRGTPSARGRSVLVLRPLERQLGILIEQLAGRTALAAELDTEGVFAGTTVVDGRPVTLVHAERLCAATGGMHV